MMASYLGLDLGTSSVKAILVNQDQVLLAEASAPLEVSRPFPLWSEQSPEEWWQAVLKAVAAIKSERPAEFAWLKAIGLSGQQHGAVLLDKDGHVLRPAILWNDGRAGAECLELMQTVPDFLARASNLAMAGFTAPKLLWVKKHEPDIFRAVHKVLLPKDYIRFRLSGVYAMDMSDAGGTLWHDVARRDWDDVLLAATGLDRSAMPTLVEGASASALLSDAMRREWGLAGDVVIAGGAGDNAASAVGIGAVNPGDGLLSVGTSGVLFVVTDRLRARPERGLHAMCHALPDRWHGMAVTLSAASALSYVTGLTGASGDIGALIREVEEFAADVERCRHAPIFIPYLTGERTPHNDPEASGTIAGLRAGHDRAALAYAAMEGVAFCFADDLDVVNEAGAPMTQCMLVGGGARSAFWGQMFADVMGVPLDLPEGAELGGALGAARLALLADGAGSIATICFKPQISRRFIPDPAKAELYRPRLARFRALYRAERALREGAPSA
jgi:xylulokinase